MPKASAATKPDITELEQHRGALLKFAMLQLRDRAVAEDMVQEAFVAALGALDRFEGRSSLRTWLTRILLNKISDHRRASGREVSIDAYDTDDGADGVDAFFRSNGHYVEMPHPWESPDEALTQGRFYQVLELSLGGLSPRAQRVFLLRELMGLTIQEICKELDISESNCSVYLHRCRIRLRACLEKKWFGAEQAPQGAGS